MDARLWIKSTILFSVGIGLCIPTFLTAADNVPASFKPPKNLAAKSVPQFVAIGFDDNRFVDGMEWFLNFVKDKKNPAGNGNPKTFCNAPVRATFYISTNDNKDDEKTVATWKRLVSEGNEIGNHTSTHPNGASLSESEWVSEMDACNSVLTGKVGVAQEKIYGFRTPFLEFGANTFKAMATKKFLYDCSIEHTVDEGFAWPYTMDNGLSQAANPFNGVNIGKFPGLWELPLNNLKTGLTGMDWNMWNTKMKRDEFVKLMKEDFDARYNGDRSPFIYGAHSDIYSPTNPDPYRDRQGWETAENRQKAMEDFITYVLQKPEVRFVPCINIIEWMRNPVTLEATPITTDLSKTSATPLIINKINASTIEFTLTQAGTYSIGINTASGKQISLYENLTLNSGINTFNLNANLPVGIYLAKISGVGVNTQAKFNVIR